MLGMQMEEPIEILLLLNHEKKKQLLISNYQIIFDYITTNYKLLLETYQM
jgi:hypothetical protein